MAPQAPPRANVLSAADYVRKLFEIKGLNWAAMGGLSVLWYGHQRELFDISVVYDLHNFQRIKDLLQEERRVKCPKDMNNLSATRVLITTGPFYNDPHCSQDADVEFNLIPSGSCGTPTGDLLRKNQELLRFNIDGKLRSLRSLNLLYLLKTAMFSCRAPNLPHDPKEDILFLCTAYAQEVSKIRRHLDKAELQAIFFCTTFFAKLPPNEQRICSIGLLGKQYPSKLLSARPSPSAYEEMRARPKPTQPQLRTMHNQNQRDGARANRTLLLPVPLTSDQRGHGPGSSSNIFVKDTRHSRNRSTSAIPEPSAVALERLRSREDSGNKPAVPSPRPRAIKHTRSPSYPPPRSFPRPSQFDGPSPIPQPAPVMPTAGLRRNAHVRKRSRENAQSHSQSDKPLPPSPMLQSLCHARITSIGHDPTDPLQTPVTEETSSTATFEESSLSNSGDSAVDTSIATSGATSGDTSPTRASTDEPLTPPLSPSRTPRRHTDLKIFIPKSNTPPPTLISRLPTPPYHDPQSQAPGPLQVPSRNVAVTEGRPSHLAQGEAPGLLPTSRPNGLVYEQRKSRPKLRQLQITGYEAFAHGPYSAGLSSTDTMILSTLAPWCVEQDPPEREYITRVHVNGAAEISEPPDVLGLEEDVTPVQTPRVYEGKSEYADVSPLSEGSAVGSGIVSAMSDQSYYGILTEVYGCVDTGVVVDGWLRGG